MAKLSDFRSDTVAINDGIWLRVNEAVWGDLEILSRGFTDEFVDARNARNAKAAEKYDGDAARIPNSEQRRINAALLEDYLILGVRNLTDDDGKPVELSVFHGLLYDPTYNKLSGACWEAARKVSQRSASQMEKAAGNSHAPSKPISNGAISAVV